jgi:hypothetical protein
MRDLLEVENSGIGLRNRGLQVRILPGVLKIMLFFTIATPTGYTLPHKPGVSP